MKALVIVDMQNDFITGPLGTPEAKEVEKRITHDLDFTSFSEIYLTRDTHYPEYLDTAEGKKLPIPHCIYGTDGWEISYSIMEKVRKYHTHHFHRLDKYGFGYIHWDRLSIYSLEEIVIVGVCTDICVISNALMLKSLYRETPITVIGSMCAGTTPEMHEKALDVMRSCQIEVI